MYTFLWYPKCSTCRKAKAFLDNHQVDYQAVDMIQDVPSAQQLEEWLNNSELPLRRFFNTSGQKYRELGLKDQLDGFNKTEAAKVLATDGMLIKRPLLIKDNRVQAIGFKETEYENLFG
ncbi:arsenate reductase family protein [Enterococcus sp. HY326]|uniref:arsenate reductase family protein n=1 Tax=Enterococcus sp. HY326 TaxID=2971265 RepID=UPI00223EA7CF|nr:arsenate reductase family protein [Enterococcus sp. HY326]